jgi:hypothetical protein
LRALVILCDFIIACLTGFIQGKIFETIEDLRKHAARSFDIEEGISVDLDEKMVSVG